MIIGAILVQNVSWSNTVKALDNLREGGLLDFTAVAEADPEEIEKRIVPTRFYRMKTARLQAFARMVRDRYEGNVTALLAEPFGRLRETLLGVMGIGEETADDILLYAANLPSFVVDAYTRRIFYRLGLAAKEVPYGTLRAFFMANLPEDAALFGHYHALIDALGHRVCLSSRPRCGECPLLPACPREGLEGSSPD